MSGEMSGLWRGVRGLRRNRAMISRRLRRVGRDACEETGMVPRVGLFPFSRLVGVPGRDASAEDAD